MAVSKRTGRKSLAANDFLIPLPPGPPTANDVGTNRPFDDGAAVVEFSPVDLAVSYKIYAAAAGQTTVTATGASSPIIVTGLKSNTLYTFTATGINSSGGESDPSDPSTSTLITSVPSTMSAPTASSPNPNQDVVSWTALTTNTGGKTITGYIWTASDGKTNLAGGTPGGGPTASTSVTVDQEAGTAQTYTVYAINANGNGSQSLPSTSITTTFSVFGFVPFSVFGFMPFSVFGFMPFSVFGFMPFKVFGFSPFKVFGFAPFRVFSFSPRRCIAENTEIATLNSNNEVILVKAKDLVVGAKVLSPVWDEIYDKQELSPYESRIEYNSLTNKKMSVATVLSILEKSVSETVIFNNDESKEYSLTQPVLARKLNGQDAWEFTKDLEVNDIIWEYDLNAKEYKEVLVESIKINNTVKNVYQISVDNVDTFIAGNIICHNK
jgi:hypothetical protein